MGTTQITKAQRLALMNVDGARLDCSKSTGEALVRKGLARKLRSGEFSITAAGRKLSATGRCERSGAQWSGTCSGVGKLVEDPFEADVYKNYDVMRYLCDEHLQRLCDDI